MSTSSLRLSEYLHKKVKEIAHRDNVSINQFINVALAEKLSAMLTEEYLQARANASNREAFEKILSKVPDIEPEEHDRV
mgnify:FL=1